MLDFFIYLFFSAHLFCLLVLHTGEAYRDGHNEGAKASKPFKTITIVSIHSKAWYKNFFFPIGFLRVLFCNMQQV